MICRLYLKARVGGVACNILIDMGASVSITNITNIGLPITCKCLELQVLRGILVRAHLDKSELFETENRYWMGRMYYSTAQVEKTIIGTDMLNELHCLLNLGDSTHLQILSDNNSTVIPLDYAPNSMMLPFPGAWSSAEA